MINVEYRCTYYFDLKQRGITVYFAYKLFTPNI